MLGDGESPTRTRKSPRRRRWTHRTTSPRRMYKLSEPADVVLSGWWFRWTMPPTGLLIFRPRVEWNFVIAQRPDQGVQQERLDGQERVPSNLPGNRNQNRRNKYSILDCVFPTKRKPHSDMMCWDGSGTMTVIQSSTPRSAEVHQNKDALLDTSRLNPTKFVPSPIYQCTPDSISQALNSNFRFEDKLDGL